jgi:mannose-6-phosphate isomerase-like protein (cupin superfamily)
VVCACIVLLTSCASGAATPVSTRAVGAHVDDLAGGRLDALPSGTLFVRVIRFVQPPRSRFASKKHQPGFVYQVSGDQVLALAGGPTVRLAPGQAYYHLSVAHTHINPGAGASFWLFLALWPSAARAQPNVNPLAQISYDTRDLTPRPATGPYSESLQLVSIDTAGHTASTERTGMQVLYGLSGRLRLRVGHRTRTLGPGSGTYVAPRTALQVFATGGPAELLDFTVTPVGQPFEVQHAG